MKTLYLVTRGDCNAGDHQILGGFMEEHRAETFARAMESVEPGQPCTVEPCPFEPEPNLLQRTRDEMEALGMAPEWAERLARVRCTPAGDIFDLDFAFEWPRGKASDFLHLDTLDLGELEARIVRGDIGGLDQQFIDVSLTCDRLRRKSSPLPASV